jgi:hypothetical protein
VVHNGQHRVRFWYKSRIFFWLMIWITCVCVYIYISQASFKGVLLHNVRYAYISVRVGGIWVLEWEVACEAWALSAPPTNRLHLPFHLHGKDGLNYVVILVVRNEKLKFGKWFAVLKKENHLKKIKKAFSVKAQIFLVDSYFLSYQTLKIYY